MKNKKNNVRREVAEFYKNKKREYLEIIKNEHRYNSQMLQKIRDVVEIAEQQNFLATAFFNTASRIIGHVPNIREIVTIYEGANDFFIDGEGCNYGAESIDEAVRMTVSDYFIQCENCGDYILPDEAETDNRGRKFCKCDCLEKFED